MYTMHTMFVLDSWDYGRASVFRQAFNLISTIFDKMMDTKEKHQNKYRTCPGNT